MCNQKSSEEEVSSSLDRSSTVRLSEQQHWYNEDYCCLLVAVSQGLLGRCRRLICCILFWLGTLHLLHTQNANVVVRAASAAVLPVAAVDSEICAPDVGGSRDCVTSNCLKCSFLVVMPSKPAALQGGSSSTNRLIYLFISDCTLSSSQRTSQQQ